MWSAHMGQNGSRTQAEPGKFSADSIPPQTHIPVDSAKAGTT